MTALRLARLGLGLGPVAGDDLRDGPVVVAGDQQVLTADFPFQRGAGPTSMFQVRRRSPGLVAGQFPGDDPPDRWLAGDGVISASTLSLPRRVLPRARAAAQLVQFLAPWPRCAVDLAARLLCSSGECARMARRCAP